MYNKSWVEEWDKPKIYEKIVDLLDFVFTHIIYYGLRFHIIAFIGVIIGFLWIYYGVVVNQSTGIWLLFSQMSGMFIIIISILYSVTRLHREI